MDPIVEQLQTALRSDVAKSRYLSSYPLDSLALPSIRLMTESVAQIELGLGESRIGGLPDVPPKFVWPRWKPRLPRQDRYNAIWDPEDPQPLSFIAQIDLDSLPSIDNALPSRGFLYFFYDGFCEPWGFEPNDRGSCRVMYFDIDREDLSRAKYPADLPEEFRYSPTRVSTSIELTLPNYADDIPEKPPASEKYQDLRESLAAEPRDVQHRLLGHPQVIQSPMEISVQEATSGYQQKELATYDDEIVGEVLKGAVDWRLLLQIDSDDNPGWMWGDSGRLYFWIRQQDLASKNFASAWLILQSS